MLVKYIEYVKFLEYVEYVKILKTTILKHVIIRILNVDTHFLSKITVHTMS